MAWWLWALCGLGCVGLGFAIGGAFVLFRFGKGFMR